MKERTGKKDDNRRRKERSGNKDDDSRKKRDRVSRIRERMAEKQKINE